MIFTNFSTHIHASLSHFRIRRDTFSTMSLASIFPPFAQVPACYGLQFVKHFLPVASRPVHPCAFRTLAEIRSCLENIIRNSAEGRLHRYLKQIDIAQTAS